MITGRRFVRFPARMRRSTSKPSVFGTLLHWAGALPGKAWWEHVYFSGITYLTIGYGDLAPSGPFARFLAVIEGGFGIGTFGMLIASVTKKVMYR